MRLAALERDGYACRCCPNDAASGVTLEIDSSAIRFLPGALEYARQGAIPGGLGSNREFVSPHVEISGTPPQEVVDLLYDPQTSGGLLVSLPEAEAALFLDSSPAFGKAQMGRRQSRPPYRRFS